MGAHRLAPPPLCHRLSSPRPRLPPRPPRPRPRPRPRPSDEVFLLCTSFVPSLSSSSGQLTREEIELSSKDENRPLVIKSSDIEISNSEKKTKKYIPLSKRQDKPDSALWLIRQHNILKDSQIAKLVGITKNSVTAIRNKSYWNYNNLNPKDPVALNLFTQKDLVEAIEKAERRVKREKKQKEKAKLEQQSAS